MTQSSGVPFLGWTGTWVVLGLAALGPLAVLFLDRYYFLLPALLVLVVGLPYSEHRRRGNAQVLPTQT